MLVEELADPLSELLGNLLVPHEAVDCDALAEGFQVEDSVLLNYLEEEVHHNGEDDDCEHNSSDAAGALVDVQGGDVAVAHGGSHGAYTEVIAKEEACLDAAIEDDPEVAVIEEP